jgi:protein-S-isoprenylcysteine O-methyltransferase Ste14
LPFFRNHGIFFNEATVHSVQKKPAIILLDYILMLASAVLGAGSVFLFAASVTRVFAGIRLPWTEPMLLLWNAGLSGAFFLQHSGMIRRQFRAHMEGVLPERYQGAFYSIVSGIVLTLVALTWQHSGHYAYRLQGPMFWLILGGAGLALVVLAWTGLALRSFDLLGLEPIRAHIKGSRYQSSLFVVRGPYRWVRHPTYLSILMLFWCTPVLSYDRLLFNVLWTGWIVVGTMLEEKDLIAQFGDAYQNYQRRVPMLIPRLSPTTPEPD